MFIARIQTAHFLQIWWERAETYTGTAHTSQTCYVVCVNDSNHLVCLLCNRSLSDNFPFNACFEHQALLVFSLTENNAITLCFYDQINRPLGFVIKNNTNLILGMGKYNF